jgi:hypothetical protein
MNSSGATPSLRRYSCNIRWRPGRKEVRAARSITIHAEGEFMANLAGLASFVSALRVERTNLVNQLRHVDAALSVLGKLDGGSSRTLSASTRRRMSIAQRARWARAKGRARKPKRTISAAGRRKIAAAQRARWAKVRAQQKKGK